MSYSPVTAILQFYYRAVSSQMRLVESNLHEDSILLHRLGGSELEYDSIGQVAMYTDAILTKMSPSDHTARQATSPVPGKLRHEREHLERMVSEDTVLLGELGRFHRIVESVLAQESDEVRMVLKSRYGDERSLSSVAEGDMCVSRQALWNRLSKILPRLEVRLEELYCVPSSFPMIIQRYCRSYPKLFQQKNV